MPVRLARYSRNDRQRVGAVVGSTVRELDFGFRDALVLAAAGSTDVIEQALTGRVHDLTDVTLLPPVAGSLRGVICVGINYLEHQQESADVFTAEVPVKPIIFFKPSSTVASPDAELELPAEVSSEFDWEVELGVVIGAPGRHVHREDAGRLIAGYTIVNDITARDLQREHVQWFMGKSVDAATPIGPWVVTRDELGLAPDLEISLQVNGRRKQLARTSELLFDAAALIESISCVTTFQPGDVIATGTPRGVGFKSKPPEFLRDGDVVEATVEGIGTLRNRAVVRPVSTSDSTSDSDKPLQKGIPA